MRPSIHYCVVYLNHETHVWPRRKGMFERVKHRERLLTRWIALRLEATPEPHPVALQTNARPIDGHGIRYAQRNPRREDWHTRQRLRKGGTNEFGWGDYDVQSAHDSCPV